VSASALYLASHVEVDTDFCLFETQQIEKLLYQKISREILCRLSRQFPYSELEYPSRVISDVYEQGNDSFKFLGALMYCRRYLDAVKSDLDGVPRNLGS
jgi:hypothetical protein